MPRLLEPVVLGPLSTCSTTVWVRGHLSGSIVSIFASGVRIGGGMSISADHQFSLDRTLSFGEEVGAVQEVDGDRSPPPQNPILVQQGPQSANEVGLLAPVVPVYECSKCIWFNGAVPGAEVELRVNGTVRAAGSSYNGDIVLSFESGLQQADILEIKQNACDLEGPVFEDQALERWGTGLGGVHGRIASPQILSPLVACQNAFEIVGILPGADVTIIRDDVPYATMCFSGGRSSFAFGNDVLKEGEKISIFQAFPSCDIPPTRPRDHYVSAVDEMPPGVIITPICSGSGRIMINNLTPGATVSVALENGGELGLFEAVRTTQEINLPALPSADRLIIEQELCGFKNASEPVYIAGALPNFPTELSISSPLFVCAR